MEREREAGAVEQPGGQRKRQEQRNSLVEREVCLRDVFVSVPNAIITDRPFRESARALATC